jgi:ketosteroid isomerase-like protein
MPDQPQSTEELIELVRQGARFGSGTVLEGPEGIAELERLLAERADPDFVTVMHSESSVQEYQGITGFREALTDWMSPYERFRLVIDETIAEQDKLVFLVRQVATTKHAGVEVETPSAAIWWFTGGRISQAVFYLDQHTALKAAGIDPDRPRDG